MVGDILRALGSKRLPNDAADRALASLIVAFSEAAMLPKDERDELLSTFWTASSELIEATIAANAAKMAT